MQNNIILKAEELRNILSREDTEIIADVDSEYASIQSCFRRINSTGYNKMLPDVKDELIGKFKALGKKLNAIVSAETRFHVFSFSTERSGAHEVSRIIAKLRDENTHHYEFVYYIQRAYELLFSFAFYDTEITRRNYMIVKTPVHHPVQNYAVHRIPDIDDRIKDTIMCVLLRGALLPSMIVSKEIEEFSSSRYITPFALFKIRRNDQRNESDMEYIFDVENSFFKLDELDGKDLVFADPMNATGGSLIAISQFLDANGIKPKSIICLNVITALKGGFQVLRAIGNASIYTLWLDPVLNTQAYILPGLGDAGDRLNGADDPEDPRNIIRLLADYGSYIADLYRRQISRIEKTVFHS